MEDVLNLKKVNTSLILHILKKKTKSSEKDIVTIPYDAYQLIDIARNLLFKADYLIRQNCNISDISDLIDNI